MSIGFEISVDDSIVASAPQAENGILLFAFFSSGLKYQYSLQSLGKDREPGSLYYSESDAFGTIKVEIKNISNTVGEPIPSDDFSRQLRLFRYQYLSERLSNTKKPAADRQWLRVAYGEKVCAIPIEESRENVLSLHMINDTIKLSIGEKEFISTSAIKDTHWVEANLTPGEMIVISRMDRPPKEPAPLSESIREIEGTSITDRQRAELASLQVEFDPEN